MKTDLNKVIFADSREELEQKIAEEQSKAKGKDCHEKLCGVDRLRLNRGFKADTFTPTFNQVIAAGFKREEPQSKDGAFEEAHGYPYFLVNFESKEFIIEWDIETHQLRIFVCGVPIEYISLQKATRIIYEFRNRNK